MESILANLKKRKNKMLLTPAQGNLEDHEGKIPEHRRR